VGGEGGAGAEHRWRDGRVRVRGRGDPRGDRPPIAGAPSRAGALPPPESRFLRLPILADCATSGLPASEFRRPLAGEDPEFQSAVASAKYGQARRALARLQDHVAEGWRVARSIDELERAGDLPALGVVHADGNGIGTVFFDFDRHAGTAGDASGNRRYVDTLRRFSLGLELCTEAAFASALAALGDGAAEGHVPVVPLVLGGDDFTAVCDGRIAIALARAFLAGFEEATAQSVIDPVGDTVAGVSRAAFGVPRLAACAGVAIVKPHFPFHAAYDLAAALLAEAKGVKRLAVDAGGASIPCSAFDFHLHGTGSGTDLRFIREERASRDGRCRLWGGPYVVTPFAALAGAAEPERIRASHVERLQARVQIVRDEDEDGRRRLPGGLLHDLRAGLFEGKDVSDSRVRLALPRYADRGLAGLLEDDGARPSLFRPDGPAFFVTSFLDVLDASELWR